MPNGLTAKQEAFVSEYVAHRNATKAAKLAGYSEASAYSTGHDNLKKPEIAEAIRQKMREIIERIDATSEDVAREWMRIAFADLRDVMKIENGVVSIRPTSEWPDGIAGAITEVRQSWSESGPTTTIKTADKLAALKKLSEWMNMMTGGKGSEQNPIRLQVQLVEDDTEGVEE